MINLIVTVPGYVESSHMAKLFWRAELPWAKTEAYQSKDDVEKALSPERALFNLVEDLSYIYRRDFLVVKDFYEYHFKHEINKYDLSVVECTKCDKPIRDPFNPEEFQDWLRNLTHAVASAGIGELSIDELERWWQWDSYKEILGHDFAPEEVLLVEEKFDEHGAASVKPDKNFTDEEKEMLGEFVNEHPYKVKQSEGFWEAHTIYTHLDEDADEAVNKVDWL